MHTYIKRCCRLGLIVIDIKNKIGNKLSKKLLAILLIASIISAGCASSVANPVPVAQVGDETKSCDAITNEMQKMITAQEIADGDRNSQIGSNAALAITGIFLIVPWFFMDLGGAASAEQKAAKARYERLQQMQIDKKCPATPVKSINETASMPYLIEACKSHYQNFLAATEPYKAFAISDDGHCGWRSGSSDVSKAALDKCKSFSKQNCQLYAVNNRVVLYKDVLPTDTPQATTVTPARAAITPGAKPMPTSDLPNPAKKLEDLNTMLKKGLITQQEYDAKKGEILRAM